MAVTQFIGPRQAPLWADPVEWTSTRAYEPYTFVTYQGDSYCTRQNTPIGIDITNGTYWVKVSDFNAQAKAMQQRVLAQLEANETDVSKMITTGENTINKAIANANIAMNAQVAAVEEVKEEFQNSLTQVDTNTSTITVNQRIAAQTNMQQRFHNYMWVGHQGNFTSAPGNSKPSYEAAIAAGYKILECDVQITSDNVLVLSHDNDLSIWTDSTGYISNTLYADLMQIDITKGSHANRYTNLHYMKLDEYLRLCNANGCIAFVEDKINNPILIADTCVNEIGFNWCYMGSVENCNSVLTKYPNAAACAVIQNPSNTDWDNASNYQLVGIHTMAANITQDMVNYAHSKGQLIGAWNTNEDNTIDTMISYGVDFINVDGTIYTTTRNPNGSTNGTHLAAGTRYLSSIAANYASKHIGHLTTANILYQQIDFQNNSIGYSATENSRTSIVDFIFTESYVQAVQLNQSNDYYRYALRSNSDFGSVQKIWSSEWVTESDVYYLKWVYGNTERPTNQNLYTIGVGNQDGSIIGDIDILNAREQIHFVNDDVANLMSFRIPISNTLNSFHVYIKPIPASQGDNFTYYAADLDPDVIKCSIYGLDENYNQVQDSGYLTNDGTITMSNAKTRFAMLVFTPQGDHPLRKSHILHFCPTYNSLVGIS